VTVSFLRRTGRQLLCAFWTVMPYSVEAAGPSEMSLHGITTQKTWDLNHHRRESLKTRSRCLN